MRFTGFVLATAVALGPTAPQQAQPPEQMMVRIGEGTPEKRFGVTEAAYVRLDPASLVRVAVRARDHTAWRQRILLQSDSIPTGQSPFPPPVVSLPTAGGDLLLTLSRFEALSVGSSEGVSFTLTGTILTDTGSDPQAKAVFVARNGILHGTVISQDRLLEYRFTGDELRYVVEEVDPRVQPNGREAPPVVPPPPDDDPSPPLAEDALNPGGVLSPDVEVLGLYTAEALKEFAEERQLPEGASTTRSAFEAYITEAFVLARDAFAQANLAGELSLIGLSLFRYAEKDNTTKFPPKAALRKTLPLVAEVRDGKSADLAFLVVKSVANSPSVFGISYLLDKPNWDKKSFGPWAVSLVRQDMAGAPRYSLAHELGHLFGANHHRLDGGVANTPVIPAAFAFKNTTRVSLMAYPGSNQTRGLYFSSPPDWGVPGMEDNQLCLETVWQGVAGFRSRP